jgi:hypothetical protein
MSFDFLISGVTHSTGVSITVALQILGCILAAGLFHALHIEVYITHISFPVVFLVNDLEYNPSGYAYIFLYNAATASVY